jgi:hypothetical protein
MVSFVATDSDRMLNRFTLFVTACSIVFCTLECPAQSASSITPVELRNHVEYLASDELEGRYPGSYGDLAAANYILDNYTNYGLLPLDFLGFQNFKVTTGSRKGHLNNLSIAGRPARPDIDFMPMPISEDGEVSGSMVFLGYGFHIQTDSLLWDDYAGLITKDKVGVILLGAPEPGEDVKDDPFLTYGSTRSKLLNARDAGISAVILVAGPGYDDKDELIFSTTRESSAGLPVVRATRALMNNYASQLGMTIEEAESQLNETHKPLSRPFRLNAEIQTGVIKKVSDIQNIMAYIPAADTGSHQEWIVVGAHYDHLGFGGIGSSSRMPDVTRIHPGADDNASGVAAIIEIAGNLAARSHELKRSILFVAFAGEEMGLLGSKYFIEHAPVNLKDISAMFNFDMVGRPNEEYKVLISGTGTSVEADSLLDIINSGPIKYSRSPEGYGPSDHASFYSAGIPVFYFTTGLHLDYHTPSDTPDKINFEFLRTMSEQAAELIFSIANADHKLTFRESGPKLIDSDRRKPKVTLGIMPDVTTTDNKGLRVDFATPGKPAQLAGIQKGDRIVAINGLPVTNIYDYMTRLQALKPSQTVNVELLRGESKIVALVQL